ncbi:hypothetical protein SAMD00019534_045410 [Acytostelium subglobosum LB1]|uniref:hypothetical protein n=1 Tax=Acytostelium subglobosum LB1 TaxID=1410327 RepID=UPI000644D4EF|nr:hypothetical protein SAMD00019534_045410 [Acytostelium subglobosum LB1]GAM21366.1 hypothetical protein SAMD00019534_045410 [Acytostelium subglobosum LB1]|eukprot:XP_012755485.1 hypothetical protein SAMD00019534_045410 [Acytostelium subglobosum LB1]
MAIITLTVKSQKGNQFPVQVDTQDRLYQLYHTVSEVSHESVYNFNLAFDGSLLPLDNENETIDTCGIEQGDVISLMH